ncbi:hypothetical protein GCM10028787_10440 [Brachybacterium horti]
MRMTFLGADTEALLAIGGRIGTEAHQVTAVVEDVATKLESVSWVGEDRDRAIDAAHQILSSARELTDRLQAAADELRGHAEAQDEASAPGDNTSQGSGGSAGLFDLPSLTGLSDIGGAFQNFLTFGPDDFDPLDWVVGTAEQAAGWTWDHIGVPVVNGLASFGQAMIDNPAATASSLLGLGLMAVGATGEGLGIALLPTGLVSAGAGTAAGGAVMIGSAELIAAGAALTAGGGAVLLSEAAENPQSPASPREPDVYRPSSGSGGSPRPSQDVLGDMPPGKSKGVKTVGSDAELQTAFDDMARGGEVFRRPGYKGEWVRQPDGTEIGLRSESSSGGRTIDVINPDGSKAKVHIR